MTYTLVGLMSGTSLDGLDMVLCSFFYDNNRWIFKVEKSDTVEYNKELTETLRTLHTVDAETFCRVDREYGKYLGECVNRFLADSKKRPCAIASHGHTIFHNPAAGYTVQVGHGASIASETGIPVIYDFRSLDVALGGHGAPLVPVGDRDLFGEYDMCLNLGGFSNISFDNKGKRVAGDISVCNYILNMLAQKEGKDFDENGNMARSGSIIHGLLASLNHLPYYQKPFPKSLGREWVENNVIPMITQKRPTADIMSTCVEHITSQIAYSINMATGNRVLTTGGGARNIFLIEKIKSKTEKKIIIPQREIIDYKEAIVFAWLGLLRMVEKPNIMAEVTGASRNNCGGIICSL